MNKIVLVIGSGGREHAIVWKLSQSAEIETIFVSPGSAGLQTVPKTKNIELDIKNVTKVAEWCKIHHIDLVVVGPEEPLSNGLADVLESHGIPTFGPKRDAAKIETDKEWAKFFMDRYSIPTARWKSFTNAEEAKAFIKTADYNALVVKASGLAAGKGVVVAKNIEEACNAVDDMLVSKKFGGAGNTIVIEELLVGEEVSILAFTDGNVIKPLLPAQDYKRIFENDIGPNTGGMGAYCPCLSIDSDTTSFVHNNIIQKTITGLKNENIRFVGILYAGIILTSDGPKVLEFNCRFGDPETEVILPLLESDLFQIMMNCSQGKLQSSDVKWKSDMFSVGIVLASEGYPETSSKGRIIKGIKKAESMNDVLIFHCGTTVKNNNFVTNGGRVVIAVSLHNNLLFSIGKALKACSFIEFSGKQFRRDIGSKGVSRSILKFGTSTYELSGVSIEGGNKLVENIKPITKSTFRPEVIGGIGSFGGLFDLLMANYHNPVLVSGTDGVGTKLKVAQEIDLHKTVGIDLVAMCVNDILAHGAEPLFFLDYFSCGSLNISIAKDVIFGISEGCKQAGCALIGGETAEMAGMYTGNEYDLAGFSVGAVEKEKILPKKDLINNGDVIIGLASSGIHSNGFSLVRSTLKYAGVNYSDIASFSKENKTYGEEFLKPTKIYVKNVLPLMKNGKVKAFAHITGGGLVENIPRVLPENLIVEIDAEYWKIPVEFGWLATYGNISEAEMLKTFNCGIGGVIITEKQYVNDILCSFAPSEAFEIGHVSHRTSDCQQVIIKNFTKSIASVMQPFVLPLISKLTVRKKRVGVLISGSGTNLQALIDFTLESQNNVPAEIVIVISNKPNVEGLNRASRADIPTKVIKHQDFKTREEFDTAVHEELIQNDVEIVCLAGFMRILSGDFVRKWKGKLLNIHPALLPLFKGTHAQKQALNAGVRVSGCTVHFVDEDVDAGQIIAQEAVPVFPYDTEDTLSERIKEAEHRTYPKALQLLVSERVILGNDNKLIWSL